jgi:release factor glutamine methyltransferase
MLTSRALLAHGRAVLDAAGVTAPAQDAEWLLADLLGGDRLRLLIDDAEVPGDVAEIYRRRLARRARHEPRQHIVGWEEFCGLRVSVSRDVLIPRQETEGLVAWALDLLPPGGTAWDVGTGSGCIACALASARRDGTVIASDRSMLALAMAGRNVRRLGLGGHVQLVAADLLTAVSSASVDVVVANPPYMPDGIAPSLPEEVRGWEPREALDGGADGTAVAARIIADAPRVLRASGWLVMEIGEAQATALAEGLRVAGFVDVEVRQDLTGRDRYLAGRRPGRTS